MASREVFFTILSCKATDNTAENAADNRASEKDESKDVGKDKSETADNTVDNEAPDGVIWETIGCTTAPTHL